MAAFWEWATEGSLLEWLMGLSTVALAWLTLELLRATNRLAAANNEPNVVVSLEPSPWSVIHADLVIQNTGSGPAFDVRLTFNPPLQRIDDVKDVPLALNAISVLRPNQLLRNLVGRGLPLVDTAYDVKIDCTSSPRSKKRIITRYSLSMGHYEGNIDVNGGAPEYFAARELEKIRKALETFSRGNNHLNVDIHSAQDRADKAAALRKRFRQDPEQPVG